MEFNIADLRVIKPYMEELKESDPDRYDRIILKYNETFKDMVPYSGEGPGVVEFLKDIFCEESANAS